jgi:hypothetical protein
LGVAPLRIDIVTSIEGVSFEDAWTSRIDDQIDEIPVHLINSELLIANKTAVARYKDLADAERLAKPRRGPKLK